MPSKNSIKHYADNSYYHIYNLGVEKRAIFSDQQDYAVFISYLRDYLTPKDSEKLLEKLSSPLITSQEKNEILRKLRINNFTDEITLLAFCLMPNHFHLLIKQKNSGSIDKFMNSLATRYTMYFNKKYERVGSLFQGVYKAVLVSTNEQLLQLSRYIHKQAMNSYHLAGQDWLYSYPEYLREKQTSWVKPEEVLNFFSKNNPNLSYRNFTTQKDNKLDLSPISTLVIEKD